MSTARPALGATSAERRETVARLLSSGMEPLDVEVAARILVADPDADMRWLAAEALVKARARLPLGVIQRSLQDPQDRVRAAAVRLAARRGTRALPLLIPLVTQRRWPLAQSNALDAIKRIVEDEGHVPASELGMLLGAVAALDPPPLRAERPALEGIARAIGTDSLERHLGGGEQERLGAARLLLAEASPAALRLAARLSDDPSEEVRRAAAAATHLLGQYRPTARTESGSAPSGTGVAPAQQEAPGERDLLASLARALADPDSSVRTEAGSALQRAPRPLLVEWVVGLLEEGSPDEAASAALVIEHVPLNQVAGALLQRASGLPADARAPYLGALSTLQIDPAEMAEQVRGVDPAHRQEAVRLAWQLGGRSLLSTLRSLLDDTAGPVRMAVMEVLNESGDPAAVQIAEDLLANDSSAAVRATAVYTLARSDPLTRMKALSRAIGDPDPDVRATAIEALPRGSAAEMMDLLLPGLQDPDERVWQASLRQLTALPEEDLSPLWTALRESSPAKREELVRSIERTDPDRLAALAVQNANRPEVRDRLLATELAARAGTSESTATVVAALSDPDPTVRRTAATAMSTLRTPAAVGVLTRSLSDPQVDVRVEAVRALGMIDDDGVPPVLIQALKDPELRVREMAADALTRWQAPAVARQLASALSSPDLRRPAGDVLARIGRTAVRPLVEVATGEDVEAAAAAGSLLERIAGPSAFTAGLDSVDPEERLDAVLVLGAMGGPVAADALLGALTDPDVRVRARAATLLGGIGELRAVKPLRRMFLSDPVGEAAAAAETALRLLGSVPQGGGDLRVVEDAPSEELTEPPRE
jgi:HEAT repeat protein